MVIGHAAHPTFQVSAAAISTGSRNSPPTGSVTASASPRAVTSDASDSGRAIRNSFSGEPARTASLLAARAARLPSVLVPRISASAAIWPAMSALCAMIANACVNRPAYAAP